MPNLRTYSIPRGRSKLSRADYEHAPAWAGCVPKTLLDIVEFAARASPFGQNAHRITIDAVYSCFCGIRTLLTNHGEA